MKIQTDHVIATPFIACKMSPAEGGGGLTSPFAGSVFDEE